jgi:hypothetical protein
MTGRTLNILKGNAQWKDIDDIHILYKYLLDTGFEPDDMSYEELAQTCHNLRRYELFGKTAGYVWDVFYNICPVEPIKGENNESN